MVIEPTVKQPPASSGSVLGYVFFFGGGSQGQLFTKARWAGGVGDQPTAGVWIVRRLRPCTLGITGQCCGWCGVPEGCG